MPLKFKCFKKKETGQVCYIPAGRYGNFLNTINTTANFSIKTVKQWLLAVIPGLTRNPEVIENPGFPIKEFGNDEKIRCSIKKIVSFVKYNMPRYYVALITLTVAENLQEIGYEHLHRVMTLIKTRLKRAGSTLVYMAVKEYQERGAIHYHVMCIYEKPYVLPSSKDIAKSWGLGFVKITVPKIRIRLRKIVGYLGKYIGKGLSMRLSISRNLLQQVR